MKRALALAVLLVASVGIAGTLVLSGPAVDDGSAELTNFSGYNQFDGGVCVDLFSRMRAPTLADGGPGDYLQPPKQPDRCCGPFASLTPVMRTCWGVYKGVVGVDGGGP